MALEILSSKKSTSYNRANNTRYVYLTTIYWDDVNNTRVKERKVIGKIDPETGQEVETGPRGRRKIDFSPTGSETYSSNSKKRSRQVDEKNKKNARMVVKALGGINSTLDRLENDLRSIKDYIQTISESIESVLQSENIV